MVSVNFRHTAYCMTMENLSNFPNLTVDSKDTSDPAAASMERLEQAIYQMTFQDPLHSPTFPVSRSQPDAVLPDHNGTEELERLWLLDEQLDCHMKVILSSLDALTSQSESAQKDVLSHLAEEKQWMQTSIHELRLIEEHSNSSIRTLGNAMLDRLFEFSAAIDCYLEILYARAPTTDVSNKSNPTKVRTGESFYKSNAWLNMKLPIRQLF